MNALISAFLQPGVELEKMEKFYSHPVLHPTEAIKANAYYFGQKEWAEEYLEYCHRSDNFISRWKKVLGDWTNKIVVDIGCGPGNLYASIQGKPKLLIGIDVAPKSLELAAELGYTSVLADATELPFISGFADIVALNATLHHCDDMAAVLKESARLVKPGGLLVTDHDPQLHAWNYKGLAMLLWNARLVLYRWFGKGFHKTGSQQYWGLACEIHHKPGDGVTNELFFNTLQPMGFDVEVYSHNHTNGAELFDGKKDRAPFKYRLGNFLSGRNPDADKSALSLMCIAKKKGAP